MNTSELENKNDIFDINSLVKQLKETWSIKIKDAERLRNKIYRSVNEQSIVQHPILLSLLLKIVSHLSNLYSDRSNRRMFTVSVIMMVIAILSLGAVIISIIVK
jgi:hypothetical protein